MSRSVLVVAGEISGDMHAAKLVHAARARDPSLRFYGIGGDFLRAEGLSDKIGGADRTATIEDLIAGTK